MKLGKKEQKSLYAWCLEEGLSVEYGKLSLCDLRNFRHSPVFSNRKYQVHCEDKKHLFSKIYNDIDAAIEQFIILKKKVRRIT